MGDFKLDSIVSNYDYLNSQNIVDFYALQSAFFGFGFPNNEVLKERLQDFINSYQHLPGYSWVLNHESSPSYLLDLRDSLIYIHGLIDWYEKDIDDTLLEHILRDSETSINQYQIYRTYDRKNIEILDDVPIYMDDKYGKYFKGNIYTILHMLGCLDKSYSDKLINMDSKMCQYIDSLDIVSEWDSIDNYLKKTDLFTNEFISKLLYASFIDNDDISKVKLSDEILDRAINLDERDSNIVNKVKKLFPCAFLTSNSNYQNFYSSIVPKMYFYKRLSFLEQTYSYKVMVRKEGKEDYYKDYLRNIDCYIRSNLDSIKDPSFTDSFLLFDYKINDKVKQEKRISEWTNKYYHEFLERTLLEAVYDKYPIGTTDKRNKYLKELKNTIRCADYFRNELHIPFYVIADKASKYVEFRAPFITKLVNYMKSNIKEVNNGNIDSDISDNLVTFLSFLIPDEYREETIKKIRNQLLEVITSLYLLAELDKDVLYVVELNSYEKELLGDFYG